MIPVILKSHIVIFNQEIRTIDNIIVRCISFLTPHPREINLIKTGFYNLIIKPVSGMVLKIMCILLDQEVQDSQLIFIKLASGYPVVRGNPLTAFGIRND